MSVTLYFLKIRVASHVLEAYESKEKLKEVLTVLSNNLKDDIEYQRKDERKLEEEEYTYEATYKFKYMERLGKEYNKSIVGTVIKTSDVFVNSLNEETGEMSSKPVENAEMIDFYFDVFNELVVFYTRKRFGYDEFTIAFEQLINEAIKDEEEEYEFEVSLVRKGINIDEINEELKRLGKLRDLKITINPPNPNEDLLNEIHKNGEEYLDAIKEANATSASILFTSKAKHGLNLESDMLKKEIYKINSIHSKLSSEEAISKNYASVEAHDIKGRKFSTKDNRPLKDTVHDSIKKNRTTFMEVCKQKVLSLLLLR